ncbi:MAG: glycosyltransferase family 25 protein [Chromatiales bacterium]|nr:glycosyltransferase family 25 protein [Chromatiales bacterium]
MYSQAYREAIADQLDIDEQQLDYFFKRYSKSKSALGALACSLSHIKVYDLMIKNNISRACVLEDDCRLLPTFSQILAESQAFLSDIIMFGHVSSLIWKILTMWDYKIEGKKRSIFNIYARSIYKLMRYKKYYPQLPLYMIYSILLATVRGAFLRFLKLKRHRFNPAMIMTKIGGIPSLDTSFRHRFRSKHSLIEPWLNSCAASSGMGYMLTRSAAIKWKQAIMYLCIPFDIVHGQLYCRGDLDLLIVYPPCVIGFPAYSYYSLHAK